MTDSCSPRKLEPGLEQMYSMPSDLRMSTMKSDPVRSVVSTSTSLDMDGSATDRGGSACCAFAAGAPAASAAAPPAAIFKKLRRSTEVFFDLAMAFGTAEPLCPPPEPAVSCLSLLRNLVHVGTILLETP